MGQMKYVIQYSEADGPWEKHDEDTDPVLLLKRFVGDVNSEDADGCRFYWRVTTSDEPVYLKNICPVCKEPQLGSHYHEQEENDDEEESNDEGQTKPRT